MLKNAGQAIRDWRETFMKQLMEELQSPLFTLSKCVIEKLKSLVNLSVMFELSSFFVKLCDIGAYVITVFFGLLNFPVSCHRFSRLFKSKSFGGITKFDLVFATSCFAASAFSASSLALASSPAFFFSSSCF